MVKERRGGISPYQIYSFISLSASVIKNTARQKGNLIILRRRTCLQIIKLHVTHAQTTVIHIGNLISAIHPQEY